MNNNLNYRKRIWIAIAFFLLGIMLLRGLLLYIFKPDAGGNQTPTTYQLIDSSNKTIEQIWTRNDISASYSTKGGVMIDSTETDIYFLGNLAEENPIRGASLIKFNLLTGEIVWRAIDNRPAPFGEPMATGLSANSNQILVSFYGTTSISGETLNGAAKLKAYDINGDILWSQLIGGARSITTMITTDDTVSVNGSFSSNYYMFNVHNSELINVTPKDSGNFIWFIDGNVKYEQIEDFFIQAVDTTTDTIIWKNSVNELIYLPPILSDNYIIIRTNAARFLGSVSALNRETGEIIWEHSKVLSNVVVAQQRVYFLTQDMQLIGTDIDTGDVLISASFSPNEAVDSVNNVYQITVDNNRIVIYFGGTHELSAFNILPEN